MILVGSHTGAVDWNRSYDIFYELFYVGSHTGAVDWNHSKTNFIFGIASRFPHGSRGLKFLIPFLQFLVYVVGSHTGAVDWNSFINLLRTILFVGSHTGAVDWNY